MHLGLRSWNRQEAASKDWVLHQKLAWPQVASQDARRQQEFVLDMFDGFWCTHVRKPVDISNIPPVYYLNLCKILSMNSMLVSCSTSHRKPSEFPLSLQVCVDILMVDCGILQFLPALATKDFLFPVGHLIAEAMDKLKSKEVQGSSSRNQKKVIEWLAKKGSDPSIWFLFTSCLLLSCFRTCISRNLRIWQW